MQFSILTLAALASVAVAMPQEIVERGGGGKSSGSGSKGGSSGGSGGSGGGSGSSGTAYTPCPSGLYNVPQCCATNVLGVISLDCSTASVAPTSAASFKTACGANQPVCCSVPVLGQDLLCVKATGT